MTSPIVAYSHRAFRISTKDMLAKVEQFFVGRAELAEEFKTFLKPKPATEVVAPPIVAMDTAVVVPVEEPAPSADAADSQQDFLVHAQKLVDLIKNCYSHRPDVYQGFLQLLKQYVSQSISFERVALKVSDLFVEQPGLIEAFASFLPDSRAKALRSLADHKRREADPVAKKPVKSTKSSKRRMLEGYEKKVQSLGSGRTLRSNADPEWTENTNGDRHTRYGPCYVVLSDEKVQSRHKYATGRDRLGWSVINDRLVCTQNGNEAYRDSFKNSHEEVLFRVEDDQFELDIMIGKCLSTLEKLRDMQTAINANTFDAGSLESGDFPVIGPLQRIALKAIFREGFETALEVLRQSPQKFFSDFLPKFEQQTNQWVQSRYNWRGIWRNSQRRCYARSLDYQGSLLKTEELRKSNPTWIVSQARRALFSATVQANAPDFHQLLRFPAARADSFDLLRPLVQKIARKLYPSGNQAADATFALQNFENVLKCEAPSGSALSSFYGLQSHFVVFFLLHLLVDKLAVARTLCSFDSAVFDFPRALEPLPETEWLHVFVQQIELHGLPQVGAPNCAPPSNGLGSAPIAAPENADKGSPPASDVDMMDVDAGRDSSSEDDSESGDSGVPDVATPAESAPRSERSKRDQARSLPFGYIPEGLSYDLNDPMLNVLPAKKFETFLSVLQDLVDGCVDQQSYEDACLKMLGPHSYPLFSVHASLMQLARQGMALATASWSCALKQTWNATLADEQALRDALYRQAPRGERLVKFSFAPLTGELFVTLETVPSERNVVSERDRWLNYVSAFVAMPPNNMNALRRVYLRRNVRRAARRPLQFHHAVSSDGLEAVLRPTDFRMVYVEGTTDFYMNTRPDTAARTPALNGLDRSRRLAQIVSRLQS